jgi:ArsR family transcriptional regulator
MAMTQTLQQDQLFDLQAGICKTFTNPWRLRIVDALGDRELPVSELVEALGIPKSNVSQHLGIMREKGIVQCRREGGHVYYWLASPKIVLACSLMREVLLERLESAGELSRWSRR